MSYRPSREEIARAIGLAQALTDYTKDAMVRRVGQKIIVCLAGETAEQDDAAAVGGEEGGDDPAVALQAPQLLQAAGEHAVGAANPVDEEVERS